MFLNLCCCFIKSRDLYFFSFLILLLFLFYSKKSPFLFSYYSIIFLHGLLTNKWKKIGGWNSFSKEMLTPIPYIDFCLIFQECRMTVCPVCRVEVVNLVSHLEIHTKSDIVSALINQETQRCPGSNSLNAALDIQAPGGSESREDGEDNHNGPIHIQRTLNNFSIINNINSQFIPPSSTLVSGTSSFAQQTSSNILHHENSNLIQPGSSSVESAGTSGILLPGTSNIIQPGNLKPAFQPSVMVPSMIGNHMVCGGILPVNVMGSLSSTPLLFPQVNGPTLLINVPSYFSYQGIQGMPGMMVPSFYGNQIATANSNTSLSYVVVPSSTTTTAVLSEVKVSSAQDSSLAVTASVSSAVTSPVVTPMEVEEDEDPVEDTYDDLSDEGENEVDGSEPVKVANLRPTTVRSPSPIPGPSDITSKATILSSILAKNLSPEKSKDTKQETSIQQSVISHMDSSRLFRTGKDVPISQPWSVSSVQDSLLPRAELQERIPPVEDEDEETEKLNQEKTELPQLNINFQDMFPAHLSGPSSSSGRARPATSSVIVSLNSVSEQSEPPGKPLSPVGPTTINTVEALHSALACDSDVQLVVSNQLMETPEFKALMQDMEHSSILDQTSVPASSARTPVENPDLDFTSHESVSTSFSSESTRDQFDHPQHILSFPPPSEDDLTLQDLIAVETIDESRMPEDDDISWTGQLSADSFQYISNIIENNKPNELFKCDKCGLHYGSLCEYKDHSVVCHVYRKDMITKVKKQTMFPDLRIPPSSTITSRAQTFYTHVKLEPPEHFRLVKSELTVANQDPLAASTNHWKCAQCKNVFDSGPSLLRHLDEIKAAKIKCLSCHKVFLEKDALVEHSNLAHPKKLVKLKKDPEQSIDDYLKNLLPNEMGEFSCDRCDRAFGEKSMLLKHMTCHFNAKPFECLKCGKRFAKLTLMKEHTKRHFEPKKYACLYCEKTFFVPGKLKEHMRIHTGEAPLKCDICSRGFKRHSNLSEHKRTHYPSEVKPAKELFCPTCGEQFKTKRELDWHVEEVHER